MMPIRGRSALQELRSQLQPCHLPHPTSVEPHYTPLPSELLCLLFKFDRKRLRETLWERRSPFGRESSPYACRSEMPPLSDLVRDSEFAQTTVHGKVTRHVFARSGRNSRQRKIWEEQRWQQVALLGKGFHGDVWKETLVLGSKGPQVRAVKVIRKTGQYGRELEAIAKFSQEKVNMSQSV